MMEKRSFFERLTGAGQNNIHKNISEEPQIVHELPSDEEGQLTLDMWQTPNEIVIQTIVGGVKPEDIEVSVSHEMVTVRGKRSKTNSTSGPDYFYQELFWGTFSRTILLPQEVDADNAEATIKHGLLTLRLPKLDKTKTQRLKVKNE